MPKRTFARAWGVPLALLLACNAGSSLVTSRGDAEPSPGEDDPSTTDAGASPVALADSGTIADGQIPIGDDVDPGSPHVQLVGRFDVSSSAGATCAWPGCRIVARFDGTSVSATMNEIDDDWMEGAPSEWDVSIDGRIVKRLVTAPGVATYVLATGLPAGVHTVELYKRSEAQNGMTQFRGFDFGGGALLAPPARKTRRIEMIGDSAAAGFGIEGVGQADAGDCPGADWGAHWQDFHRSFGALLAESVDAELYGTVYSGKGIAQNIWSNDPETLPILFDRTLPTRPTSSWDFGRWTPDVVVVMAGGNDFAIGQPFDRGPATLGDFIAAYRAFVADIRQRYPNAHVFLTVSPSTSDEEPAGRSTRSNVLAGVQAVTSARNAEGDAKVHWYAPAILPKSELIACNGHGTPEWHASVAADLAGFIRPKVGW